MMYAQGLSFQGYTGLLNIPTATVASHGQVDAYYADQLFYRGRYTHNQNVFGNFGIFPNVEVGGRLSWDETHSNCFTEGCGDLRDLSANIKVVLPFIPQDWFSVAIGAQDVGGAASRFESQYGVVGRQFGPLEVHAGLGRTKARDRY
ncbi:MAG: YjbH domain-containing protein, partial [Gammaproteobacteria bacterium]|nr:YjbH domain-containing protein [Gammaproteobacteria bacterium]